MDLNIVTFIFFALALVIFIQLRNVLGRRTGSERPPFDPYAASGESAREQADKAEPAPIKAEPYAAIDAYAPAGGALNEALRSIRRADGDFDPREFLSGARAAYEMILADFAKGNLDGLKPLLAENVYADFAQAVEARREAGETVKFSFVGLEKAEIAEAVLADGEAQLTVSFKAEIISASYNKAGEKIDGDAQEIITLRDRWTFVRNVHSKAPDWLLVSTSGEDTAGDTADEA